MEKELFDDLISAINEAIEHERGNIKLRTSVREIDDEKIDEMFFERYKKLSQPDKLEAIKVIDRLYYASSMLK